MSDDIRVLEEKEIPASTFAQPCMHCEAHVRTVAFNLRGQEFGTAGRVRLCAACLLALTLALQEPQQPAQGEPPPEADQPLAEGS